MDLSQNSDALGQFLEAFGKLAATLGEGVPVNKGIVSGLFQDEVEVVLDIFNFDLSHDQQIYIITFKIKFIVSILEVFKLIIERTYFISYPSCKNA